MSDETTLLPCPFCGGEAQVQHQSRMLYGDVVDWYGVYCKKQFCGYVSGQQTEAEAIAAWNTRADYHGYEQAAIEAWESIKAWNTRAELGSGTCENLGKRYSGTWFICSKCGAESAKGTYSERWMRQDHTDEECAEYNGEAFNYCPNCGKRVSA